MNIYAVFIARVSTVLAMLFSSLSFAAAGPDDPAWRNFQHARGEPALIGANAQHSMADAPWRPIPERLLQDVDPGRYRLGSDLFHDGRLSSGNSVACVTCHAGALSGADRRRVSIGVGGARGTMNALSVFNAAFNFRQFWDGRAVTLEDQALEPIQNPVEMAHTLDAVLAMLQSDTAYPERFRALYPDGVTINNMADAIAHFQRIRFIRHDTPFQRFLDDDREALDEQSRRGMQRFEEIGCASCHNGINLGGNSYQKLGADTAYYDERREAGPDDSGVMKRSGRERDRHVFRVPGLHGVASTPPYFHDGSVAALQEAISAMAEHQLGRELEAQDLEDIEAFLRSLGGGVAPRPPQVTDRAARPAGEQNDRTGSASSETHEQAYRAAIRAVESAGRRLLPEMMRIRDADVAHFDFLQARHIDMIRHARALHHPPSSIDEPQRVALIREAQTLLAGVNELEWIIADFLRTDLQPDAGATMAAMEAARPAQLADAIRALYEAH